MPFRDVVGHRRLVGLLQRAVARDTLPPSLIFCGPSGVGKTTAAVALAQVVNCERLDAPPLSDDLVEPRDACGTCRACRAIGKAAAAYRDGRGRQAIDCLLWLGPDDRASIKVEAVRDVLARAGYRPFDGRQRLVVIDEAHCLETASQQALLKTLEEPPPTTRFVLVTTQPDALLPTVRSRCPQLRFAPLPAADIARALAERHGWAPADAQAAAALADGCLGRALGEGDRELRQARDVAAAVLQEVAASRGSLDRLSVAQSLIAPPERPEGPSKAGTSGTAGKRGRAQKKRSDGAKGRNGTASRHEIAARLDAMGALLRDIGVLMTRADERRLANADLAPQLGALATAFDGDRLVRAFTVVDRARVALERNGSQKIVADWLAVNL